MVSRAAVLLALLGLVALSSTALAQGHGHGHGHDKNHGQGHKEQGVNIEKCKNMGKDAGGKAAQQACDTTMLYCRGGQRSVGNPARTKVSLEQCGNAAYGICQNRATDAKVSPCGGSFNGVNQCNKDEFQKFYNGEVDWWCNQAVAEFDKKN